MAWTGRTKRLLGDIEAAAEAIARALRLLTEEDSSASSEAALLALDMDDLSSASKHIDAAAIHGNSATIHYVRGNISGRKGFLDKALMHYDEALSLDASHIRARLNRTSVLMAMKEGAEFLMTARFSLIWLHHLPLPDYDVLKVTCC